MEHHHSVLTEKPNKKILTIKFSLFFVSFFFFFSLLLTQIRIRVGEYDFSSSREPYPHLERSVKQKIVHPKYNFFTYENDLALVQLEQPIDFLPHISPICLPPDNIELLGRNATVTGWGRLSEGHNKFIY